jgi:hypothetical protein
MRSGAGFYPSDPFPKDGDTTKEFIGDREVTLWNSPRSTRRQTGAAWNRDRFYFVGEANDMRVAERQLAVYRTVRVTAQ